MSAPMSADTFVSRCRAKGLAVIEMTVDGIYYKDNNRNHIGPWSDLFGDTVHHTGSDTTNPAEYAKFLFRGRSDLPGPLCQRGTAPNGDVYMTGWGRANHAGAGDPDTLAALKADAVPLDREIRPDASGPSDGNRAMYGNEVMYSGGHPMTAAQLHSCLIQDVVICEYHGWTGASVIGHREWTNQKPDPGFLDLAAYRRMVNTALAGGSTGGDDVVTEAEMDRIAEKSAVKLLTYNVPWVDPITKQVAPPNHPNTSLQLTLGWVEEYTRRWAQQAKDEVLVEVKKITAGAIDYDLLATKVADLLAARLKD